MVINVPVLHDPFKEGRVLWKYYAWKKLGPHLYYEPSPYPYGDKNTIASSPILPVSVVKVN